jgi:hypothetical protein
MKSPLHFIIIFAVFLYQSASVFAQGNDKVTLSGYVKDQRNGELLIGATVAVAGSSIAVSSNAYGYYSITLPRGKYQFQFNYLGFEKQVQEINLQKSERLDIQLNVTERAIKEVVISSTKKNENVTSTGMSMNKLDMQEIKSMPALLGEVDVIRSIQTLPGVSTVGEGASGFNVRGGGVDQNLILLDEAPVYNSSHLLGFFSVFNPDAVKDVRLLKGGIPAQYGGRLSSLLDVRMKDGNSKQFSGNGGLGLISSRLTLEGPVKKEKSSFIVAARRTYGDLFLKLSPDENLRNNTAYFYDFSAKYNHTINENNRIFISGYFGRDVFKFGDFFNTSWGNGTGTFRWNHLISQKMFMNLSLIYSNYDYSLGIPTGSQAFDWTSRVINYSPKVDFGYYLSPKHTLSYGASAIFYDFAPGDVVPGNSESIFTAFNLPRQRGNEYALYIDDEYTHNSLLSIQYGIRFSAFSYVGPQTVYDYVGVDGERKTQVNPQTYNKGEVIAFYPNIEPRLAVKYSLDEFSSIKASYNRMAQYIHLISGTTAASPTDVWSPSTNNIKPEVADQVALGYFRNFLDNRIETSAEVFYKTMSNQIDYINGAELLLNKRLEGDLLYGDGRAYGLELFIKKNEGVWTGFVSYTLSKSERKINGLNNNDWYNAKYDKTHILSIVQSFEASKRLSLSANFNFSTGVATTFPNSRYEYQGIIVPHNSNESRNNYRVPAYHRLDLAATLRNKVKPNRRFSSEWVFSVYNVYGRRNAYSVYFRQNADDPSNVKTEAVRLSVFGSILPSVTYNFKF